MRKIILYISMSLDGYLADANYGVSFLEGDGSSPNDTGTYPSFIEKIDTIIMGYRTYHQVQTELSPNVWPYEKQLTYVLTHKNLTDGTNVKFINTPSIDFFNQLKTQKGKDVFLCGGAEIVKYCYDLGVIDEFRIAIIPVILGNGIKLFLPTEGQTKLSLKQVITYNGITEIIYLKKEV